MAPHSDPNIVKRQTVVTRITHWLWAFSMFFLLTTGLQIFNAHPTLYLGDQSGFEFDNAVMSISERDGKGSLEILGLSIETTGFLGISSQESRAFPSWATIPSFNDLATGRVIHFFFAWIFVFTMFAWAIGAILSGHLQRDLLPKLSDLKNLFADIRDHARLRFHHRRDYSPLQKLTYFAVLFVLFPLIIATGLAMSPGMNAAFPLLPEILGGRQSARTLHFAAASLLVLFFIIHIVMVVLAGPVNEMRSMITGWYRIDTGETHDR